MKLASYQSSFGPRAAGLRDGALVDLNRTDPAIPASMKELLAQGPEIWPRVAQAIAAGQTVAAGSVELLAPVPDPRKVICVGLNYADHAQESGQEPPPEPVIFCKFPTAVSAHGRPIVVPRNSTSVDYEAELVVVIGRGGRHIPREAALSHVAGYCPGNDVSARDWQLHKPGKQWLLGKTFDTFAPFGPYLVTPDEAGDVGSLAIRLRLNGQTMQDSRTSQLIFPVAELIAYVSGVFTLEPGDVLFTGTPPGVGAARKPPVFLKGGDVCEVEIENLGVLRNPVVAE
ncbi:MAG: fumarylacetoacetate hydrolase family protein [Planctomycetia bacterium]|nr:fumarylacetoacetate hydrolase family protein [Planctomycetia bacterium]